MFAPGRQVPLRRLDLDHHLADLPGTELDHLGRQFANAAFPLPVGQGVPGQRDGQTHLHFPQIGLIDVDQHLHAIQSADLGDRVSCLNPGSGVNRQFVHHPAARRSNGRLADLGFHQIERGFGFMQARLGGAAILRGSQRGSLLAQPRHFRHGLLQPVARGIQFVPRGRLLA